MSKRTYLITLISVFTAVGIALNLLSSAMPRIDTFGRISLVYTFCFLAGALLGPWIGGGVAMLADFLPAVIFPEGPWMPLITLSNGVMAMFAGLFFKYLKTDKISIKLICTALCSFVVCSLGLTAVGEALLYNMGMSAYCATTTLLMNAGLDVFRATLVRRVSVQWFWLLVNTVIVWLVLKSPAFTRFVVKKIKSSTSENKQ